MQVHLNSILNELIDKNVVIDSQYKTIIVDTLYDYPYSLNRIKDEQVKEDILDAAILIDHLLWSNNVLGRPVITNRKLPELQERMKRYDNFVPEGFIDNNISYANRLIGDSLKYTKPVAQLILKSAVVYQYLVNKIYLTRISDLYDTLKAYCMDSYVDDLMLMDYHEANKEITNVLVELLDCMESRDYKTVTSVFFNILFSRGTIPVVVNERLSEPLINTAIYQHLHKVKVSRLNIWSSLKLCQISPSIMSTSIDEYIEMHGIKMKRSKILDIAEKVYHRLGSEYANYLYPVPTAPNWLVCNEQVVFLLHNLKSIMSHYGVSKLDDLNEDDNLWNPYLKKVLSKLNIEISLQECIDYIISILDKNFLANHVDNLEAATAYVQTMLHEKGMLEVLEYLQFIEYKVKSSK